MPRQTTTYQFDLFSSQHDAEAAQTPQWQTLPAETRRSVKRLIISLILDHVDGDHAVQRKEADRDA